MYRKITIQIIAMDGNGKQPMYWLRQDVNGDITRGAYSKETGHETVHTATKNLPGEYHYKFDRNLNIGKVIWNKTFDIRTFKGIKPLGTLGLAPIVRSQGLGPKSCDLMLTFDIQSFLMKKGKPIPTVTPFLFEVTRDPRREKKLEEEGQAAVGDPCAFYLCRMTTPWLAFVTNWKTGMPK